MTKYLFLSDEWLVEAHRIRAEYRDKAEPISEKVRINLVITEMPFGPESKHAHVDTSGGEIELREGHVDAADVRVEADYTTVKGLLVEGNFDIGMQAFMSGRVLIDGDMSKLLILQSVVPDTTTQELTSRIKEITAD